MKKVINSQFLQRQKEIDALVQNFEHGGTLVAQSRNTIKIFDLAHIKANIKSFGVPNLLNRIVYRFFRKGKAERSFEYALKLQDLGIGTPQPIAYYEFYKGLFFDRSYYISEQISDHFTFRELLKGPRDKRFEDILRAFTRFTYQMHEKSIFFLDHSQGNTLISGDENGYDFFLVDLNRMQFKHLDLRQRIKNFERLATEKQDVWIMSDEYARCEGVDIETIFPLMWSDTLSYQARFYRKKRLKKKLKFWKS
jgi:hypothetical protein